MTLAPSKGSTSPNVIEATVESMNCIQATESDGVAQSTEAKASKAPAEPETEPKEESEGVARKKPIIRDRYDLTLVESTDPKTRTFLSSTVYYISPEHEVWFGFTPNKHAGMSLDELQALLELVPDERIFPAVPEGAELTMAPEWPASAGAFVKMPGLYHYEGKEKEWIPKAFLAETLVVERIFKTGSPHPNIVKYLGCRVHRGRITALLFENLDKTLSSCVGTPEFEQLDKAKFLDAVESALEHLHSLGLAHNDLNPHNIMIKDGMPVLIDFGGCRPFGEKLSSLGTPGWCENDVVWTSEKKNDAFGMKKLRAWMDNPDSK